MTPDRIKQKFQDIRRDGRTGLVMFLTAGFPDMETTIDLVPELVSAGADAIELGIPFSDPLAEGPTIQESSFKALQQGVTLEDCLGAVDRLRRQVPETPLLLMGYYNPIHSYGLEKFAVASKQAGVDGLIVVDLPHDEVAPLEDQCVSRGIHIVPLLAPTSTDSSIEASCASATGFVYCLSLTGVTGARDSVSSRGLDLVDRVRAHTSLPLAVGFGISRREHVVEVCRKADAAVVGSALVRVMLESPTGQVTKRATELVAELSGTQQ